MKTSSIYSKSGKLGLHILLQTNGERRVSRLLIFLHTCVASHRSMYSILRKQHTIQGIRCIGWDRSDQQKNLKKKKMKKVLSMIEVEKEIEGETKI